MAPAASDDSDALKAYLRAISRIPRLTLEEERELTRRVKTDGDEAALRRLVEGNLRFVVSYAKRYRGLGVPFLATALAMNRFFAAFAKIRRHYHAIEVTSGVLLVVIGVLIFTNRFTVIAQWLSPYLPVY